jgi:hypothetical protein
MIETQDPKTIAYKVIKDDKEKIYDIPENTVEKFLKDNPEAELFEEEVKENGVVETDASVTPEPNQASNTDLALDPGSSEFSRENLDLNLKPTNFLELDPKGKKIVPEFENAIQFSDAENLLFEREEDSVSEDGKTIKGDYVIPIDFNPYQVEVGKEIEFTRGGKIIKIDKETKTVVPYEDELKEATDMLQSPNKFGLAWEPIANPSTENIQDLASFIIKTDEKKALLRKKTQKYLQTLTNKEREALAPYEANKYIKNKDKFNRLQQEGEVLLDKYVKSANLFNLKNISEKINDPDYKFDVTGLGDIELVEVLAKRIKDMGDPAMLFTQPSIDLYNNLVDNYNIERKNVKTVKLENGQIIPAATFDLLKSLQAENNNVLNTLSSIESEKEGLPTDIKTSEQLLGYLKLNYSEIEKLGKKVQDVLLPLIPNLAVSAAGLAQDVVSSAVELAEKAEIMPKGSAEMMTKFGLSGRITEAREYKDWFNNQLEKNYREKYVQDLDLKDGFSSVTNVGKFLAQEFIGQAGTISMLYFGGAAIGFTGIGLDSYQSQMRNLKNEEDMPFAEKTSVLEKFAVAAGYAGLEVTLGGIPTLKILQRAKQVINESLETGARTLFNKGVGSFMLQGAKAAGWGAAFEAPTEGMTVIGQNGIDVLRGAKTPNQIMENVPHAMVVGGMLGSTMSASPYIVGATYSLFSDYNSYEGFRGNQKEITTLYNKSKGMDKRTKTYKIIQGQIKDLKGKNESILKTVESKITNNLTKEGFYAFRDATTRQEAIRTKAKEVEQDYKNSKKTAVDLDKRETALESLLKDFQALELARRNFKESFTMNIGLLSKEEQLKYEQKARLDLESTGKDFTNQEVREKAEKIWQEESFDKNSEKDYLTIKRFNKSGINTSYAMSDSNSESIRKFKTALDARVADTNHPMDEAEAKKLLNEFKEGISNGALNGVNLLTFNKDGKRVYDIIVDRTNAIKNGKTSTGIHEMGHTLFAETISTNSDAFQLVALNVMGWLKINNPKAHTRINERIKNQKNWDEVLTNFLEEVPRMQLEAENNKDLLAILSQGLPDAISDATGGSSNFNLKGGLDTFEFLSTLANKLKTGTLTINDIKQLKKGVELDGVIDLVEETTKTKVSQSKTPATVLAAEAVELGGFKNLSSTKQEDLRTQYNNIAKKALGFIEGKGIEGKPKITKAEAISFVALEMEGIIDRFKPGKGNQFSTFVDANIKPKRQAFYSQEQKIDKQAVETRLSDERARQIEGTEDADSRITQAERSRSEAKTDTKRIDVLSFKRAKDKVQELAKAVKLTAVDIASGLTFKNISDKFAGPVGEIIYDIPADRITTNRTLNYSDTVVDGIPVPSEASKIQSKFNNEQEVKNFLKILPPENVSQDTAVIGKQGVIKDVSREFKGISLGLKGRVLNYFYEKTGKRSGGLTSQPGVWKLKPQFINPTDATVKKLQRDMGITGRGELNIPIKAKARTEFGTFIKGIAKLDSALIALRLATQAIETSPVKTAKPKQQIVADASAGKSKLMFSETNQRIGDLIDSLDNPNFDVDKTIDKVLERNGIKPTFKFKTTEDVDIYIENLKKFVLPLMPRDFWFGKSGGTEFTPGIRSKSSWFKLYNDYYKPQMEALSGLPDSAFGKPVYVTKIDPKTKKSVKVEVDYKRSAYSTIFKNPAIIRKNKKNGKIEDYNKKVGAIHEALWDRINTTIRGDKTKEAARGISNYLKLTGSQSNHWHKAGAEFVGFSTNPVGKVNKKGVKTLYEYEHAMPATAAYMYLIDVALHPDYNFDAAYKAVMDNYKLIALDKAQNDKLNIAKLGRGMPLGWRLGENFWWQRYFNSKVGAIEGGIDPQSIEMTNGRLLGDQLGIDSQGKRTTPALRKSESNAKSFNENILPNNIKFAKSDTNQNVINEMERLDTEAQQARLRKSETENLSGQFNSIIERATGIGKEKQYGKTKARAVGGTKGKWDWAGIPPSAQDFVGLTRYFAGKGKEGDATIAWIKENFLDPFARANIDISNAQVSLANDFKALKKLMKISPKDLNKRIVGEPYTVGNAIRVFTWTKQGMKIPGLSKADAKILNDFVTADENLEIFANNLIGINKDNGYPKPQDSWLAGTITTDLLSGLNTVVRAKYLKQWQANVNEVFTEENLNKLEAAYGKGYREALENILGRMKSGSNRGSMGDTLTGRFVDWLNGSIGAIMFFNMRSAVLQTISAVNFVNWSDNNLLKAAAAFGNQPQYWGDVVMLMNSDYLVQRRNGLKINVNEADIAEIAAESKNKAKAFINKLLKLGFLPTQIADSFAIASGGATFYRNRVKSLIKDGMAQKEAEAQAFLDFREIAEESQQSSRPDRISAQQAGPMGRVILAFANTPAQYARLMQKAASDLKNRRGDDKTNISKILYYGMIQNVIFNALQQALFAMAFDDEEATDEIKNKKYTGIINGMADSLLRGLGFHGAAVSTLKNVIMKLASGAKAQDAAIEMLDISPPISSKIGKLRSAGRTWDWNKKEIMEKGWSLDNPAWLASGQVISAGTNVPLDRGVRKLQNLIDASNAENEEWMRVANTLGWAKWELEWEKDKKPAVSSSRTRSRSTSRSRSRSRTRD